ncbi:MAG: glycosyltransferase [Candidatus Omnitrophota bacterium]|nr:glycosyltransferase [Candidatus Omnitrophota bacterium]
MKLSIVIPVHNEQDCIKKVAESLVWELKQNAIEYEIIIVNDNSTDSTCAILEEIAILHTRS